jgi:hypothetical protein
VLINALKEIDYSDSGQAMVGYSINRALEQITKGVNAGYRSPPPGEEPNQDDIYWNARVVKSWHEFWMKNGLDKEAFDKVLQRNAEDKEKQ